MSRFLEIEPEFYDPQRAKFVVLPCPHEATTTYGKGTKNGPAAILKASQQVENFDEELGYEPYRKTLIYTDKPVSITRLASRVASLLDNDKIPVVLGGEHSLTPVVVGALKNKYPDLSVLQLDAHADLRDLYHKSKQSHACAMRRTLEICPVVQAGIRSISAEEYEWSRQSGQLEKIHFGRVIEAAKVKNQLSDHVYITIDVDVFDPAVIPATGTPEPGGLIWSEVLALLKAVCAAKQVMGFDVVELAPRRGDVISDFTTAKLIYKLIGYLSAR